MRPLKDINLVMIMKLAWSFLSSIDDLSKFLKFKFMDKHGGRIRYYKKSSIWVGLKLGLKELQSRSQWLVHDGKI